MNWGGDFRVNSDGGMERIPQTYAFSLNDIREGLKGYEELVRKYPEAIDSAQIQYELAGAYFTQGSWKEAKKYFERLLREHPACNVAPTAKEYLARCEEALHGRKPKKQEPLSPLQALKRRADLFYASRRYKEAAELYHKLAISSPDTPKGQQAQFRSGLSLYEAKDFTGAIDEWRYFQAFCPQSSWADHALEGIGNAQVDGLEKIQDGISTYKKLLMKYPKSLVAPRVLHRIGMLWFELGEHEKAEQAFKNEITLYPESENVHIAKAFLEKKEEIMKSQLGPTASTQLAKLMTAADLFYESKEYQRAQLKYEQIVKDWPSREEGQYALYQLGNCHHFQWESKQALYAWDRLLASYPKSQWADDALLMTGIEYTGPLRNRKKGEDSFRKVVHTYPQGSDAALAQHYIGVLYLWDGKFDQAVKEFNQELTLYPDSGFSDQTMLMVKKIKNGDYEGVYPLR